MPTLNVQTPTFGQIYNTFKESEDTLRFADGKGIYTSNKVSNSGIKATFGFKDDLNQRILKFREARDEIKNALNRVKPGLGDRVMIRLELDDQAQSQLIKKGIKGTDMEAINQTAGDIKREMEYEESVQTAIETVQQRSEDPENQRLATLAKTALEDQNLPRITSDKHINPKALSEFMSDNAEVVTSPSFYAKGSKAHSNVDNFSCALCIGVLDRIVGNEEISAQDIIDLKKGLNPPNQSFPENVDVSQDLVGPLTDDNQDEIMKLIFDRFMPESARYMINVSGNERKEVISVFENKESTTKDRLESLKTTYETAMKAMYFADTNVSAPLKDVENFRFGYTDVNLRRDLDKALDGE